MVKTIRSIWKNNINVYSCDMTRNSVQLKPQETLEVEDAFLKTIEGKNLIKHSYIEVVKVEKKKEAENEKAKVKD